jgi:hypothetical protein
MTVAVVDTSYLNDPRLRDYLAKSETNFVALTEFLGMQVYCASRFYDKIKILAEFPKQVIVLRPTDAVRDLRLSANDMRVAMVSSDQTNGFADFCARVSLAEAGDVTEQVRIAVARDRCLAKVEEVIETARRIPPLIEEIRAGYSKHDLRVLTTKNFVNRRLDVQLSRNITHTAIELFRAHSTLPSPTELPYTFIYRFAVVANFHTLIKVAEGPTPTNPRHLYNNLVDMNFVTYATYYEGILSADELLMDVSVQVRNYLDRQERYNRANRSKLAEMERLLVEAGHIQAR